MKRSKPMKRTDMKRGSGFKRKDAGRSVLNVLATERFRHAVANSKPLEAIGPEGDLDPALIAVAKENGAAWEAIRKKPKRIAGRSAKMKAIYDGTHPSCPPCPKCHGAKTLTNYTIDGFLDAPDPVCDACNGTGREGRAALVRRMLRERPNCEIGLKLVNAYIENVGHLSITPRGERLAMMWQPWSCTQVAVDVHEVLARSAGGSILDPTNFLTGCRNCHDVAGRLNKEDAFAIGVRRSRYAGRNTEA